MLIGEVVFLVKSFPQYRKTKAKKTNILLFLTSEMARVHNFSENGLKISDRDLERIIQKFPSLNIREHWEGYVLNTNTVYTTVQNLTFQKF